MWLDIIKPIPYRPYSPLLDASRIDVRPKMGCSGLGFGSPFFGFGFASVADLSRIDSSTLSLRLRGAELPPPPLPPPWLLEDIFKGVC